MQTDAWRLNRCRVCDHNFRYRGTATRYLCNKHRESVIPPRGKYKIISFIEGLCEDQEDYLGAMSDMVVYRSHLIDLAQDEGMYGAIVQHIGGQYSIYKIVEGGNWVLMY